MQAEGAVSTFQMWLLIFSVMSIQKCVPFVRDKQTPKLMQWPEGSKGNTPASCFISLRNTKQVWFLFHLEI